MRFLLAVICILIIAATSTAQSLTDDMHKARSINLLDATAEDIGRAFGNSSPFRNGELVFARTETIIRVRYSSGKCTQEDAHGVNEDDWNVPGGRAVIIEIEPRAPVTIDQLNLGELSLRKDRLYRGRSDYHVYYNKREGVGVRTHGDEDYVNAIMFFPPAASYSRLCRDSKIQRYYSKSEWKRDWEPKYACILLNQPANVADLTLTPTGDRVFAVIATAIDPENDVLTYNYLVTGGKIMGVGAKVAWDLSDAPPGEYTITVGVDDGAGVIGKTVAKTVAVK